MEFFPNLLIITFIGLREKNIISKKQFYVFVVLYLIYTVLCIFKYLYK